jgi:hypothetical protein
MVGVYKKRRKEKIINGLHHILLYLILKMEHYTMFYICPKKERFKKGLHVDPLHEGLSYTSLKKP